MNLAPCPDCGNACSPTATVCPKCGRNFQAGDLIAAPHIPDKKKRNLLGFGIAAASVILIVTLSFILYQKFTRNRIAMNKGVLTVNGKVMKLPLNVKDFESILGKPSRKLTLSNTIYVWDDIGVFCYGRGASSEITQLSIALNDYESEIPFEFWPRKAFSGSLSIDGAEVDRDSKVPIINKKKSGKPFELSANSKKDWQLEYEDTEITVNANESQYVIEVSIWNKTMKD